MRSVFIIGCGYLGVRVARRWGQRLPVTCGRRSLPTSGAMAATQSFIIDLDREAAAPAELADSDDALLYYFVPPPSQGQTDPRLARFLRLLASARPARLVLVSTTGVYGDNQGAWVDEATPPAPHFDRARRRLDAEIQWRQWAEARHLPWVILRVPAIYGPGRLPEASLREGRPVIQRDQAPWVNRIHVDDLAAFCVAAGERPVQGIYNVSDGDPRTMTDYFYSVADCLHLPRPPALSLDQARQVLSAGMLSYLEESRRVDNRKALRDLAINLRYPTLETGLQACVADASDD